MANRTGKGGRKFGEGQKINLKGRPPVSAEIKAIKKITHAEFLEDLRRYGVMTKSALDADLKRADLTNFEEMAANIVKEAVKGNRDARQVLLDRLFGKVKDSIEINDGRELDETLDQVNKDAIVALLKSASEG